MNVTKATLRFFGTFTALELETDEGVVFVPRQKPVILSQAFVVAAGPDVDAGTVRTETNAIPPDLADGRLDAAEFSHTIADPVVVEMARRHAAGDYEGRVDERLDVPTFAEADAAQWTFAGGQIKRV